MIGVKLSTEESIMERLQFLTTEAKVIDVKKVLIILVDINVATFHYGSFHATELSVLCYLKLKFMVDSSSNLLKCYAKYIIERNFSQGLSQEIQSGGNH